MSHDNKGVWNTTPCTRDTCYSGTILDKDVTEKLLTAERHVSK